MRSIVIRVVELTGYAGVRNTEVSLPFIAQLLDGVKYMDRCDLPPLEGTERRRQRAPRGPSLRYLVKLALKCDSAEQMGHKLRRRFERQARRQGDSRPVRATVNRVTPCASVHSGTPPVSR